MIVKKQFKYKLRRQLRKYKSKGKSILFVSTALIVISLIILRVPIVNDTKKQYVVKETGVGKILSSENDAKSKKSIAEAAREQMRGEDILDKDPFARWAILENHKGGYKIIYPYGFNIKYTDTRIIVAPPSGGGKITVVISNGSYNVNLDQQGAGGEQSKVLLAARKLIEDSFEFISTSPNLEVDKQRFQQ